MQDKQITVGADPELFVTRDGKFESAFGLIEGDKMNPKEVMNGAVQVDGMALEFNILPARTVQEFCMNIELVYGQLREQIPEEYEFSDASTAVFDEVYFNSRSFGEKLIGCEGDYCGYSERINQKPDQKEAKRTAGGHVHIGWRQPTPVTQKDFKYCAKVAKACDVFLGLPSVLYDPDTERRTMYGAPGCFRPKEYGVEYRTLSNAWIQSPERIAHVFSNTKNMMDREAEWSDFDYDLVRECINTSDTELAKELCARYGIDTVQEEKQEAA